MNTMVARALRKLRSVYASISPADYRYYEADAAEHLSEEGFTRWKVKAELALLEEMETRGIAPQGAAQALRRVVRRIHTAAVYDEEGRTKHDIRALVNVAKRLMSPLLGAMVHVPATSFNIIDSANAARYKSVVLHIIIPALEKLMLALAQLVEREAETLQIGRSHKQHGEPITFGFAMAWHLERLGDCLNHLRELAVGLPGSFSGAMGASNAATLFFDDPIEFEAAVLSRLGLRRAKISTQIGPPEQLMRVLNELQLVAGVLGNMGDDLRNLQATEVGEVFEPYSQSDQVGSSTMAHKRNPINAENIKSMWKILVGRTVTILLDQISEHQRDLTNSASARTTPEFFNYVLTMIRRMTKIINGLEVNRERMALNFDLLGDLIMSEPLQILLSWAGCEDAHEVVRRNCIVIKKNRVAVMQAAARGESCTIQTSLVALTLEDEELRPYTAKLTDRQLAQLRDPQQYTGIAAQRAHEISSLWLEALTPAA